jgi:tRNA(Ile)-lysidine synthase
MENLLRETASRPASDTREPAPRGTVKRSNIRLFCGGTLKALNLGSAHGSGPSALALKKENGFVILSRAGETEREYGFSLLIKEPGLYTLKGITFEVKASGRGSVPLPERSRGPVFFAVLPFVLRGAYPDDRLERAGRKYVPSDVGKKTGKKGSLLMSAADIQGIAAFIACTDRPVPVVCRDSPESGECVECTVF